MCYHILSEVQCVTISSPLRASVLSYPSPLRFSVCTQGQLTCSVLYVHLSPQAQCENSGPANVSCVCNEGWTGDGLICTEVDNCLLETRGGCHKDADCKSLGPGQVCMVRLLNRFLLAPEAGLTGNTIASIKYS